VLVVAKDLFRGPAVRNGQSRAMAGDLVEPVGQPRMPAIPRDTVALKSLQSLAQRLNDRCGLGLAGKGGNALSQSVGLWIAYVEGHGLLGHGGDCSV
jgi:hypothetical protein